MLKEKERKEELKWKTDTKTFKGLKLTFKAMYLAFKGLKLVFKTLHLNNISLNLIEVLYLTYCKALKSPSKFINNIPRILIGTLLLSERYRVRRFEREIEQGWEIPSKPQGSFTSIFQL